MLADLETLALDVVLTTETPQAGSQFQFAAQRITQQPVYLHGRPDRLRYETLSKLLASEPLILPTESVIRAEFEDLIATLGQEQVAAREARARQQAEMEHRARLEEQSRLRPAYQEYLGVARRTAMHAVEAKRRNVNEAAVTDLRAQARVIADRSNSEAGSATRRERN